MLTTLHIIWQYAPFQGSFQTACSRALFCFTSRLWTPHIFLVRGASSAMKHMHGTHCLQWPQIVQEQLKYDFQEGAGVSAHCLTSESRCLLAGGQLYCDILCKRCCSQRRICHQNCTSCQPLQCPGALLLCNVQVQCGLSVCLPPALSLGPTVCHL